MFLCYRAVVKGEIPSDRLSMARDELLIREAYHRGRRFEEPKSGMSQEKKEEALLLIDEMLRSVKTESLKEKGKLLALCDDILLVTGERPRFQKEYFHWI